MNTPYHTGPTAVSGVNDKGEPTVAVSEHEYRRLRDCELAWGECFEALRTTPAGYRIQFGGTCGHDGAVLEIRALQNGTALAFARNRPKAEPDHGSDY